MGFLTARTVSSFKEPFVQLKVAYVLHRIILHRTIDANKEPLFIRLMYGKRCNGSEWSIFCVEIKPYRSGTT